MGITPDEINVDLPRALIGGLKRGPAEEILKRVATDYALLYEENRKQKAAIERLEREAAAEAARATEAATNVPVEPQPRVAVRRDHDELARVVLSAAQQAAREMRESARRECELMLKKASSHARELERAQVAKEAELEELDALRREACDRLRASLRAVVPELAAADAP